MLETLDWYQISWDLVLPIHVMDQVERWYMSNITLGSLILMGIQFNVPL